MKKSFILPLALTSAALFAMPGAALADDYYSEQKVVYHVNHNDEQRQMGAMRNIQNHINAVGADRMSIKVVMHGPGLSLLRHANDNQDLAAFIDQLKMQDVAFQICNNTVVNQNIDLANDLYDAAEGDIIPSGVAHLSHLQHQGYTYVRP
ncbi:DsrE family protein [Thioalkalivibrio sp. ALJ16]|uniref:DsrE family protein n=1 Tax=Thioalkalivibrio sp. ALJ16 TaxID=1158762 RepID=UPI000475C035|nr:DsrE family protein [Thioalkalivibrio sp. ALJ16]